MRLALVSYYTVVASVACLLALNGGMVNLAAAALVCLGARPLLHELEHAIHEHYLTRLANRVMKLKGHPDSPRSEHEG